MLKIPICQRTINILSAKIVLRYYVFTIKYNKKNKVLSIQKPTCVGLGGAEGVLMVSPSRCKDTNLFLFCKKNNKTLQAFKTLEELLKQAFLIKKQ